MTMQLFKFQTNRLGFRPTAQLPCSENTHLKATEKSLEQKFRVQNAKHLYNSFSTAGLGPMLKHSYFTGEPRRESRILSRLSQAFLRPVAFIWRHREPCLCPASSSLSGFSAFPAESLATADVPFRHFNFFFFLMPVFIPFVSRISCSSQISVRNFPLWSIQDMPAGKASSLFTCSDPHRLSLHALPPSIFSSCRELPSTTKLSITS